MINGLVKHIPEYLGLREKPKTYRVTLKAKGMMCNLYPVKTVVVTVTKEDRGKYTDPAGSLAALHLSPDEAHRHFDVRDGSFRFWYSAEEVVDA